jgi:hypothetical protein
VNTWSERRDGAVVAATALVCRILMVAWAWDRVPPTADGTFYHVVAQRIAAGEGYTWLWPDGAVTYAAHYPVGYPTLMAGLYYLFGPLPGVAMLLNAALGTLAVWASYGICAATLKQGGAQRWSRVAAFCVGLGLALSPTLVGYTPALMTEGAVAFCLACALRLLVASDGCESVLGRTTLVVSLGFLLGAAVLLRPQSLLFAPILGAFLWRKGILRRMAGAALLSAACLLVVLPWTLRNCQKMDRCMLVSANGGWNLLIGTFPEGKGAWVAIDGERVPPNCRTVFEEGAKDACFGRAATQRILENRAQWLMLIPDKLRATLDHTAIAADHLVESGALTQDNKSKVSFPEIAFQRILFLLALCGSWSLASPLWRKTRHLLLTLGVIGFLGGGAVGGWFASFLLMKPSEFRRPGISVGLFAVASTMLVHAVFFGAGRYSLPLLLLTAPLSAIGLRELLGLARDRRPASGYASSSESAGRIEPKVALRREV